MIWKIKGRVFSFGKTLLMGIVNLTPDSFSDGGRYGDPEKAIRRALELEKEGADLLDLGGESTRPGAQPISAKEELARILPVLRGLRGKIKIPISIDTTKPEAARACLEEGAAVINDVSGLKDSGPKMAEAVGKSGAGLVLMHRRGTPKTMQSLARYQDVAEEVLHELTASVKIALAAGLEEEQLVIDPGLGFAKTPKQNFEILRCLEKFHELGRPMMLGPSRKSFLGAVTGREPLERDYATAAVAAWAVAKGAAILRVHAVGAVRDAVRVAEAIRGGDYVRTFKMGKYQA